jgi:hypothetical protein
MYSFKRVVDKFVQYDHQLNVGFKKATVSYDLFGVVFSGGHNRFKNIVNGKSAVCESTVKQCLT